MYALLFPLALVAPAHADDTLYEYRGPFPAGQYTAAQIGAFLRENPTAEHEVRLDGWDDWRPARKVAAIADAWLHDPVTPEKAEEPTKVVEVPPVDSGDRGATPPRNAPPAAEARVEPESPAAARGFRGLGEVWAGVALPLGDSTEPVTPTLRRLAGGAEFATPAVHARLFLRFDTPSERPVHVEDAWVRAGGESGGWGRIGVARPGFGAMERFEPGRRYWVAGASAELERSSGFFPDATLGLAGGYTTSRLSVSAELADATDGGAAAAPLSAVNLDEVEARGRVSMGWGADSAVHTELSVAWRPEALGAAADRLVGALGVEVALPRLSLFVEGLGGTEGSGADSLPLLGGMATVGAPVPLHGAAVRGLSFVVGALAWDPTITGLPDAEDVPDANYEGRVGANVIWQVPAGDLTTGLGYHVGVPQDVALPVGHTLVVEAAWRY